MSLHHGYKIHISQDAYVFEPQGPGADEKAQWLKVDRKQNDVSLVASSEKRGDKVLEANALLGIITLHTSDFLIVVTSKKKVSEILGADIFLATDFRVLPISPDAKRSSTLQHPVEKTLLGLVKTHLFSAPFYFSYEYDLTSSMQRQASLGGAASALPAWRRADERFFWNRHLQSRLIDAIEAGGAANAELSRYIQPVLFGFLAIKPARINGRDIVFGVIARRSRHRAGTRYFSRGVDKEGHVSNYNETEQFVLLDQSSASGAGAGKVRGDIRLSYLQIRGSVPVYWAEVNNLRYKPDLLIMEKDDTLDAAKLHFDEQVKLYGDVFLVNLVNQKGYEQPVKEAYERLVAKLGNPNVHYTYYDFHHECKGMKFERVMDLVETMASQGLESDDYFYQDASAGAAPRVVRQQKAVLRTNCMDCLDRTNVVQSTFARAVLNKQLQSVNVLKAAKGETIDKHADFWHIFRNVWADHADVISKAYSGTGALKTDFTRTGKRSKEGALQDGVNSLTRYLKNNFFDGSRQDAYDLFTGAWTPTKGNLHLEDRALVVRSMPWILLFSLFMIFSALLLPRDSTGSLKYLIAFWVVLATVSAQYIIARGLFYVNWPKLIRPEEAIYYEGPGFYSGRKGRAGVTGKYGRNMKKTNRLPVSESAEASAKKGRRGPGYS